MKAFREWNNGLFRQLRRWLAHHGGMRTRQGASFALDILQENGISQIQIVGPDGNPITLPVADRVISPRVIVDGHFGLAIMERFVARLREADLSPAEHRFVNAGANIGTACLNAARLGFRDILAIEPDPVNCAILRANLEPLKAKGCEVSAQEVAVGSEPGTATLFRHAYNLGKHSLVAQHAAATAEDGACSVPVAPLASLLTPGEKFVLFADVEGYEPQLLAGASEALFNDCLAMCVELSPSWYDEEGRARLAELLPRFAKTYWDAETGVRAGIAELVAQIRQSGPQINAILVRER